jgi:hypothetical protein
MPDGQSTIPTDLTGDGKTDLLIKRGKKLAIYSGEKVPYRDITQEMLPDFTGKVGTFITADFNGDSLIDVYCTDTFLSGTGFTLIDEHTVTVSLLAWKDKVGIRLKTKGSLTIQLQKWDYLSKEHIKPETVFIGKEGKHPEGKLWDEFRLSPDQKEVQGLMSRLEEEEEKQQLGVYLGYDTNKKCWELHLNSPEWHNLLAILESTAPILEVTAIGFNANAKAAPDRLYINDDRKLVDRSKEAGIEGLEIAGRCVAAGDFDNDMDVDLYIVATHMSGNRPNILLENQGSGIFRNVAEAGGASGQLWGIGDGVSVADYDRDGFLDLLVTNGGWPPLLMSKGKTQLFHNTGNENHWLEIDLEGVLSNRDGVGAKVYVTASGITQVREQTNGVHQHCQDHTRLHFGLGPHKKTEEILVIWPSGVEQKLKGVDADQILHIKEPSDKPRQMFPQNPLFDKII